MGVAAARSVLEDSEQPGQFGLSLGDELDRLAKHSCSRAGSALGSHPLRPTEFEPSTHCHVRRVSLMRPKHVVVVLCACGCDGAAIVAPGVHALSIRQGRRPQTSPLFSPPCVTELAKALLWVMQRKAEPAGTVSRGPSTT